MKYMRLCITVLFSHFVIAASGAAGQNNDMVHVVCGANYVHPWISNGDATFSIKKFSPSPNYATAEGRWITGDLNGDGKTDLVHITGRNYVHPWLSSGDGNYRIKLFSPSPNYATAEGRWVTGDLNGDGKTDLVHITGRNYIHPWLSNGDGTFSIGIFSPNPNYATAEGRWVTGDLNGDGKTDLVHITGRNYIHPWISKGDGTFSIGIFSPNRNYATAEGRWVSGDLNGDGKTDLVHITGRNYVHPWLSNGDGRFNIKQFSPSPNYVTGEGRWVTGDLNGDGKTDLVHITGRNYVHPWLSNGDGNFTIKLYSPSPNYATSEGRWVTSDINSDGKTDLVHITGRNYVHPWLSNGDGNFTVTQFSPNPEYSTAVGMFVGKTTDVMACARPESKKPTKRRKRNRDCRCLERRCYTEGYLTVCTCVRKTCW